ncbi:MAG: eL32 family ribosomal protein [Candidatus Woesearchaeota archaeon]
MTDKKKLLETRKAVKSRKPEFKQQNFGRKKRISDRWRRPRGLQSKMRHKFKGYPIMISKGWRSPSAVRGTDNKGNEIIVVNNVSDLNNVQKHQVIIISGNVGNKKRLAIIEKAEQLTIPVVNIKVDKFKDKIAKQKIAKDKEKVEKSEKKKKTIEDSLKKAEKKDKDKKKSEESAAKTDEQKTDEQKAEEKKEKDDILIHKD